MSIGKRNGKKLCESGMQGSTAVSSGAVKTSKVTNKIIIISVGGSLVVPDKINISFISSLRELIHKYVQEGFKFIIIVGGGKTARDYQAAARELKDSTEVSNEDLDWLGIHATRLNAHLLRTVFSDIAYKRVLKNPTERINFGKNKLIVASGWKPGFSTDYDAVMFAKTYNSKLVINLTNVDYVYDKNPKQFKDARPLKQISWKYYRQLVGDEWSPGINVPFDPVAAKEAEKLGLTVYIINGKNLNSIQNALEGKDFIGTILK
jgi:uridylate kinase